MDFIIAHIIVPNLCPPKARIPLKQNLDHPPTVFKEPELYKYCTYTNAYEYVFSGIPNSTASQNYILTPTKIRLSRKCKNPFPWTT
jgi:hypothetical protein